MHRGRAPQVMAAARTRTVEAQVARRLRAEGYEPTLRPVDEFLRLGAEVVALKDVVTRLIEATPEEIGAGVHVESFRKAFAEQLRIYSTSQLQAAW
jgi:hypothetical protein